MAKAAKTVIEVKVLPRSSKNQIVSGEGNYFRIKLTAPPVEGKANKALVGFIAKKLGVSKGNIEIVSGKHSKTKFLRIEGCSREDVNRSLNA
ncbi:MAG TPA: YggU family protein [Desulfobacteraceae bacterium]|nr:YggU family protein [Desulfobacteraceae bacterium]